VVDWFGGGGSYKRARNNRILTEIAPNSNNPTSRTLVALVLADGTIDPEGSYLFAPGDSEHAPFRTINLGDVGPLIAEVGPRDGALAWGGDVKPVEGDEAEIVEGEAGCCFTYPSTLGGDYLPGDLSLPDDTTTTGQEGLEEEADRLL
jgi:hypothetical protein